MRVYHEIQMAMVRSLSPLPGDRSFFPDQSGLACGLRPENPKYAYTLAFYLRKQGRIDEAVGLLKALRQKHPGYKEAALLLKEISRNGEVGSDEKKP